MGKTGCGLIAFALFLIVAFASDQFYFRANREAHLLEDFREVEEDEVDPSLADPALYSPSVTDDIADERFMLNVEEMKAADARTDYIYTVKEGDSIDSLARKFLGKHQMKNILYGENPTLQHGYGIPPGTKIVIPFRHRVIVD